MRDITSLRFAVVKISAIALTSQRLEFQFYCFLIDSGRWQVGRCRECKGHLIDRGSELASRFKGAHLPCGNFRPHVVPSESEGTRLVCVRKKRAAKALLDPPVDGGGAYEEESSGTERFPAKYVALVDNLGQDALRYIFPVQSRNAEFSKGV